MRRLVAAQQLVGGVLVASIPPGGRLVLRRRDAGLRRGVRAGRRLRAHPPVASSGQVVTSTIGVVVVSGDGSRAPSAMAMRCATASGSENRSKLCTRR